MLETTGVAADSPSYYISNEEIRLLCLSYKEIVDEMPAIYSYKHDDPAHFRVPQELVIYEQYKKIYGDALWKIGANTDALNAGDNSPENAGHERDRDCDERKDDFEGSVTEEKTTRLSQNVA